MQGRGRTVVYYRDRVDELSLGGPRAAQAHETRAPGARWRKLLDGGRIEDCEVEKVLKRGWSFRRCSVVVPCMACCR